MNVWVKNTYLDGGTQQVMTEDNEIYYIDHRIGSTTDGKVFDRYPDKKDAVQLGIKINIMGTYQEWLGVPLYNGAPLYTED